jgi:PAS domain S-box-containing protein
MSLGQPRKEPLGSEAMMLREIEALQRLEEAHRLDKEKLQRNYDTQAVINALLQLSLEEVPLRDLLGRALDLLLSIEWFSFEAKGSIFVVEDDPRVLVMMAQNGIAEPVQKTCARIPFGNCLCGQVASSGKILHVGSVDSRHKKHHRNMGPHGHYRAPIVYKDSVLGVINIFVRAGHVREKHEEDFLRAIANTLAGIIVRRKTEEALQKSRKQLQDITSGLGEGVYVLDARRRSTFMNPEAERLLGWTEQELLRREVHDVIHGRKAHGRSVAAGACSVHQVIHSGEKFRTEADVFVRKDGSLLPVAFVSTPIVEEGRVVGSITCFRDISEKKKMEKELLKVRRLESVGALAGGIAHDFNNLLMAIWGNLTLAKMYSQGEDDMVQERLQEAENAARRAKDLTQQLPVFSRGGAPVKRTASLPTLVQRAVALALSGTNVRFTLSAPDDLWRAPIDEGQISQVIHHLALNAHEALPQGGEIVVRCSNRVVDGNSDLPVEAGEYICLAMQDHGVGISKKNLPLIFDPFFSTKEKRSGLGLATAYAIVSRHGGHVTAASKRGAGTTVTLYLPAAPRATAAEEVEPAAPPGALARILVMDDDAMVRTVAGMMLSRLGYEVEFATNGEDAVEIYRQAGERGLPFGAVIVDLTVSGGMGGREALKALQAIDPDVKAIASSGYSSSPIVADYRQHGFQGALPKPYQIIEMSEVLKSVLTERAA